MNNFLCSNLTRLICGLWVCGMAASASVAATMNVDAELAFLIDSSASITDPIFKKQMEAYNSIFTNPNFYDHFVKPLNLDNDKGNGTIAVSIIKFATNVEMSQDWTLIANQNDANAFGAKFLNLQMSPPGQSGTNIGGAIKFATQGNGTQQGIINNNYIGAQKIFDVGTDGIDGGSNPTTFDARDIALNAGVNVINAITIDVNSNSSFSFFVAGTNLYTNPCSIFPTGECDIPILKSNDPINNPLDIQNRNTSGIIAIAESIDNYQQTLYRKLTVELNPPTIQGDTVPEPSMVTALLTLGLLGMGSKWCR